MVSDTRVRRRKRHPKDLRPLLLSNLIQKNKTRMHQLKRRRSRREVFLALLTRIAVDPDLVGIKRPMSAYMLYNMARSPVIRRENPEIPLV